MRILHIDSSAESADASYSRRISAAIVRALVATDSNARVDYRDLAATPPPHIDGALRAGWMATDGLRTPPQVEAVTLSEGYVGELMAADVLVVGAPMYNFSIPSPLKSWIDHVAVAGQTFRYTPEGRPEGLIRGKRAYLALARGGIYSEGPAASLDHQESYLRAVLGFLGITEVEALRVEGVAYGPDPARAALEAALAQAAGLASPDRAAA